MTSSKVQVTVIVPCRNEEESIGLLLTALLQQSYPIAQFEVIIADGLSTDRTRNVVSDFSYLNPALNVQVIENMAISIPAALNRALSIASGEIIIRLDAHSIPAPDYIERCIEILQKTQAANVGGVWEIQSRTDRPFARSIAVAAAHTLGAGDARYRTGGAAGAVDTVPFGAFRRSWMDKVGLFNEELLTNEDYEYNARLRQLGGVIWFDPDIRSTYLARATLRSLIDQYYRYGYWKARMLRAFPKTLRWRQALPPLFLLATIILVPAGFFHPLFRNLLGVQWMTYLSIIVSFAAIQAYQSRDPWLIGGFPLSIAAMHLAWGSGFLMSTIQLMLRQSRDRG